MPGTSCARAPPDFKRQGVSTKANAAAVLIFIKSLIEALGCCSSSQAARAWFCQRHIMPSRRSLDHCNAVTREQG
jgi:hypothetical protein